MQRGKWTLEALLAIPESRQLSLLTYLDAYTAEVRRRLDTWLDTDPPNPKTFDELLPYCAWKAERAAIYEGIPSWGVLRRLIFERDQGICWICGTEVAWDGYDLGHLQDRLTGGLDIPSNLVVMHSFCNRGLMPIHESRAAAESWRDEYRAQGGFAREIVDTLLSKGHSLAEIQGVFV